MAKELLSRSYILFHRHGHRAAAKSLCSNDKEEWSKLISGTGDSYNLNLKYPIINENVQYEPEDKKYFPFGAISKAGASHMVAIGQSLTSFFPSLRKVPINNIKAYSTNYIRTQMSAQFLLHGMNLLPELCGTVNGNTSAQCLTIPVHVRNIKSCPLAFYERIPGISSSLVRKVQASRVFLEKENSDAVLTAKKLLATVFPTLEKGTYGFDWPAVHDYFVCRRAHQLALHSEVQHLAHIVDRHYIFRYTMYFRHPEHLAMFTLPILQEILATLKSKVARSSGDINVAENASIITGHNNDSVDSTLSVFSCHDITIYGLLHALGAEQVVDNWAAMREGEESSDVGVLKRDLFWPQYGTLMLSSNSCVLVANSLHLSITGSNLMFEIAHPSSSSSGAGFKSVSGGGGGGGGALNGSDLRVRVFLDMKPLRLDLQCIDALLLENELSHDMHSRDSASTQQAQDVVAVVESTTTARFTEEFTLSQLTVLVEKLGAVEESFFCKHHAGITTKF